MSFKWYDIDPDNLDINLTHQASPESPQPLEFLKMEPVDAFTEFSHYFNNAHYVLSHLIIKIPQATALRCRPQYFDIATRIVPEKSENPEQMKSIDAGFSAGDKDCPWPFFYVIPHPFKELKDRSLPELPAGGKWHPEGWPGAVLEGNYLTQFDPAEEQAACCLEFLDTAVSLSIALLQQA